MKDANVTFSIRSTKKQIKLENEATSGDSKLQEECRDGRKFCS